MGLPHPTQPGDIDHMIADDHAVVERLFEHLEAGRGDRRTLVDQVHFELALHATAEEVVLYPELVEHGMQEDSDEARDEHQVMKDALVVLDRTEPGEPEFEEALGTLMAEVRHHVPEEENDMLPGIRAKVGSERMAELGGEFRAAKRAAPTHAHPAAPSIGVREKVAGVLAKPLDKVRDKASGRSGRLATDASGLLDPQAQALLDAFASLEPKPAEILEPAQARKQPGPDDAVRELLRQRGESTDPEPVGSVEDVTIPGPGGDLTVRVYKPADGAGTPLPVLLWVHGGGWVLFDLDTYDASCRGLANKLGAVVVSPDYRRAPEAVFPAAHDDVLAAYRWVRENAAQLGGDPQRIGIGGESVGGNMAASTCLQLLEAGEPLPAAQALVYPLVTAEQVGESMEDAADARPLTRPLLSWMASHAFRGVPGAAEDPRVGLLELPVNRLTGLPPAIVVTAERDVLRSQGQEFAENLQAAGVEVTARHYDGVMHEFFGAAAVLDKAELAQREVAAHFGKAFGTQAAPTASPEAGAMAPDASF